MLFSRPNRGFWGRQMCGGKNEPTTRSGAQAVPPPTPLGRKGGAFSVLGADVVITGNISASADLHVDGRVDGDVTCAALVQGAQGIIAGAIIAESARIWIATSYPRPGADIA